MNDNCFEGRFTNCNQCVVLFIFLVGDNTREERLKHFNVQSINRLVFFKKIAIFKRMIGSFCYQITVMTHFRIKSDLSIYYSICSNFMIVCSCWKISSNNYIMELMGWHGWNACINNCMFELKYIYNTLNEKKSNH